MANPPKLPRARVRRVLDAQPLSAVVRPLKLRPFLECFDRGAGMPALVMQAELAGDALVISLTGHEQVLLAGTRSRDGYGELILLAEQQHPVGAEHALRLEAEAADADASHAALSYFELVRDAVAREELSYAERWYSVYFNPLGLVDGSGSGGPRSIRPRPLPS